MRGWEDLHEPSSAGNILDTGYFGEDEKGNQLPKDVP